MAFPWVKNSTWADGPGGGTNVSAARLNNLEAGVLAAAPQGVAATPPGSPVDGMVWRLPAVAASGIYWYFQYDAGSGSAYKWVFMGGSPMSNRDAAQVDTTSATYVDVGGTLTLPRAGDYVVDFGAGRAGQITNAATSYLTPKVGAAASVDNDGIQIVGVAGSFGSFTGVERRIVLTVAAADVVKLQAKAAASALRTAERFVFATPIRVS